MAQTASDQSQVGRLTWGSLLLLLFEPSPDVVAEHHFDGGMNYSTLVLRDAVGRFAELVGVDEHAHIAD